VLAVGDAPETIEDYTKQQLRWATGGFEILFTHNPLSPRRRLTLDQRLMYFVTATHYLTGIAPGVLLMVPALEIFFDLRPVTLGTSVTEWALAYAGFYVMQILLASYTLGSFRGEVLLLSTASFPIYHQALLNAFSGKEQKWHVTGSAGRRSSPFTFIRPQVYLFVFLALTSVVAIWRDLNNAQLSLATAWNLTNTAALGVFIGVAIAEHVTRDAPKRVAAQARAERPVPVPTTNPEPVAATRDRWIEAKGLSS
jgi:cellulose synthase (UDP-forming)